MALIVAVVAVGATVAFAEHWRSEAGLFKGDMRNGTIVFRPCDLTTKFSDAFYGNNNHDIVPTNISAGTIADCNAEDVKVNDQNYSQMQAYGWWECHVVSSDPDICDSGHVHIDLDQRAYTANDAMSLMCEEIAHSVGLGHRIGATTGTCLSQKFSDLHLDAHDANVIDSHYP
jgi:hypothetical protein